jgi:hypothetical protein
MSAERFGRSPPWHASTPSAPTRPFSGPTTLCPRHGAPVPSATRKRRPIAPEARPRRTAALTGTRPARRPRRRPQPRSRPGRLQAVRRQDATGRNRTQRATMSRSARVPRVTARGHHSPSIRKGLSCVAPERMGLSCAWRADRGSTAGGTCPVRGGRVWSGGRCPGRGGPPGSVLPVGVSGCGR